MMRSLWTAASGMMAQQTSVDTISNNLANVNTVGYMDCCGNTCKNIKKIQLWSEY